MVGGGNPFYLKFWVNRPPLERNRRFWTDIRSYRISRNTWRKKVQLTPIGSPPTRFPTSLRWSSYVAPNSPKGVSNAKLHFSCKISLRLKKVCYKVSFCENYKRQSCKAFIGLTIRAKKIGGATPSTWNVGSNWPLWSEIADFPSIFAHSASA